MSRKLKSETSSQYKRQQIENSQPKAKKEIVEEWVVVNGDKILLKQKSSGGNVYSKYIGKKTDKRGEELLKSLEKQGVQVKAI